MLTLMLLTAATFVVAYEVECPDGTELVAEGVSGTFKHGNSKTCSTIGECKDECDKLQSLCLAFTFDPAALMCTFFRFRFVQTYYSANDPLVDQILCAYHVAVQCPNGTEQVGEKGAFGENLIGRTMVSSVKDCETRCKTSSAGCKSFAYDPHGHERAYCTLFRTDTELNMSHVTKKAGHHDEDQILCKLGPLSPPPDCPQGTKQILKVGHFIGGSYSKWDYDLTIEACKNWCFAYEFTSNWYETHQCTAFEYDSDYAQDDASISRCKLFITKTGQLNHPSNLDQIVCGVDEAVIKIN